jgi:hypothetical protein
MLLTAHVLLLLAQVYQLFGVDRSQTVKRTVCDQADAIINAFRSCYPESENVQCYAHIVCIVSREHVSDALSMRFPCTLSHAFSQTLQKRNFDSLKLACLVHFVAPPGVAKKVALKPVSLDVQALYQYATTPAMASLLKQLFEDKYEGTQPAFVEAWSRDYGTLSDKVWYVSEPDRTIIIVGLSTIP